MCDFIFIVQRCIVTISGVLQNIDNNLHDPHFRVLPAFGPQLGFKKMQLSNAGGCLGNRLEYKTGREVIDLCCGFLANLYTGKERVFYIEYETIPEGSVTIFKGYSFASARVKTNHKMLKKALPPDSDK